MNRMHRFFIALLFFCLSTSWPLLGQVKLPQLLRDSMVVQRDVKLKIWGWAAKGERVWVTFNGRTYSTKADGEGNWFVWIPPVRAGGPYTMDIRASNKIRISHILAGDVWFCSGQSNMVHYLDLHRERYGKDIEEADYPEIRQFLVPTSTNLQGPAEDLSEGARWKSANPRDIRRFSVVAWFFAKKLYERYHIPIGLINASVGGTPIEAWASEEGLKEFPELMNVIRRNKDTAYVNSINRAAAAMRHQAEKDKQEDKGLTGEQPWYDTSYVAKGWRRINIPGYWEDQGIKDLDGVVWYRREIEIPASMTRVPAKIALGRIVDADFLYVNGIAAGHTWYQYPQRRYELPAGILRPGKNTFVVRVVNNGGKGGFVPDKPYYIAAAGDTLDLKGYWQYKVGAVYDPGRQTPGGISIQNQPTALFNAMVDPITSYRVKGVVWYQGESNAGRPEAYRRLLPALIADWRTHWRDDLPFLYVQLPNFMEANYWPSESEWAVLREAQLRTLQVPYTAMAVAIDLGEWNDIHPDNKKPIGDRLALAAEAIAYGEKDVVYSGPIYKSASVDGSKIVVTFDHTGSGLVSFDGEALHQFAVAGADKKFVWANAVIEDDKVLVWNDDVPNPRYVRYAWADNPVDANLYNEEGLPASPFRTDE